MLRLLATSSLLLTALACLNAQPMRFQHYSINDGLSQSSVKHIVQDNTGFVWLTTQDGLNRFDGKNFKIWKRRDKTRSSLSDNSLSQLVLDEKGNIWIGTLGGGINMYNPDTDSTSWIKHLTDSSQTLPDNNVSSLHYTSSKEVWAGTETGIAIVDPRTFRVKSVALNVNRKPLVITSIVEDRNGNVWAATRHDGVYIIDLESKKQVHHITKANLGLSADAIDPVRHLSCDRDGTIWIATNRGLFRSGSFTENSSIQKVNVRTTVGDFDQEAIMCTMHDHEGRLWVGTQNGILIQNKGSQVFQQYTNDLNNPYSLSDRVVLNMYEDRNQVIWVGTYNGINKYVSATPKLKTFKFDIRDRSRNLNVVRSLYTDDDSLVFTGTINALCLFDLQHETFEYIHNTAGDNLQNVFSITRDDDHQLWVGHAGGLMNIVRNKSGYVVAPPDKHPELSVFRDSEVTQFVPVGDHAYLIATLNENGLYRWNSQTGELKNYHNKGGDENSLADNKVNQIHTTHEGKIWIATNLGVSEFDPKTEVLKNHYPAGKVSLSPGQQIVNGIVNRGGILWLATNGGLIRYDPVLKKSKSFTEAEGLVNVNLYCVMWAKDSSLWMSSNKGISEFNTKTGQFKNYDATDGLQSNEYNRYAWHAARSGTLYFGGMEGFDVLKLTNRQQKDSLPIVITNIRIIDENKFADVYPVQDTRLQLRHVQNAVGFEYALLDFVKPGRNTFLCRLDGFDKEWIDNESNASISYTNLGPGDYVFRVKLKENDEKLAETSYAFTILAPFWQTRWFKGIVFIALLLMITFIVQLYYQRKLEKQRVMFERQQAVEHERTRIATDMHDDLGAGLSRIKFLSESIGVKSLQQLSIQDDVSKIREYSHEMIDKMGEIVWALNEKNDSLSDLLSFTRSYAAEYLLQHNLECSFSAPDEFPSSFVSGEFRRNIFLTVKEALHNIVKHAEAKTVNVDIVLNGNLMILLKDDGRGFDVANVRPFSNGVTNMQNRMKAIGGKLEIKRREGTIIELTAPLNL